MYGKSNFSYAWWGIEILLKNRKYLFFKLNAPTEERPEQVERGHIFKRFELRLTGNRHIYQSIQRNIEKVLSFTFDEFLKFY
jgi:hypothetical protein